MENMIQSTTEIVVCGDEQVIVLDPETAEINLGSSFQWVSHIRPMSHGLVTPLCYLWAAYYPRVAFGQEGVIMPHSALGFITNALLVLTDIKSQSVPGFPFDSHPVSIMLSVTSLLMYGLASVGEVGVSVAGLDHTSVYAVITHLGKIVSLCMLVGSLASLFYV
ncbi:hypothetical protein QVD17_28203 [Tagetes erecta]|uniref:Uncharacterized protein n=1 Tax=Tagetes erecta TaxID=13708 RepID=A0AAD8KA17_TARER|nr:hypothetical protein QVD17_28203 [Tagetes erecta]